MQPEPTYNSPQNQFDPTPRNLPRTASGAPAPPATSRPATSRPAVRICAVLMLVLALVSALAFFLPTYEFDSRTQIIKTWVTNRQVVTSAGGQPILANPHLVFLVVLLFLLAAGLLCMSVTLWIRRRPIDTVIAALVVGAATYWTLTASLGSIGSAIRYPDAHALPMAYVLLVGALLGVSACVCLILDVSKGTTRQPVA